MKKLTLTLSCFVISASVWAQTGTNDVRFNQYGVAVDRTPLQAEARNGILVFESANQDYKLWFDTRVQVDGAVFFGQDSDFDPIGNGTSIRRARFAVKAQLTPEWYGEIDTDFADGLFELKDAIVRYTGLCNWEFQVGNFKEDISMERTTTSRYLTFMERPMAVQALTPSRHLGFMARYQSGWFYGSAGMSFQEIAGAEERGYVEDNNKDYGRDEGISANMKMVFMPFDQYLDRGLHIGGAVSYRTPKTSVDPGDWGKTRFSTRNSTSINRRKYLDTDVIPNVDYDLLYTGELAGHYRGFRFQGAYVANDTHIKSSAPAGVDQSTKHFWGWYLHAAYLLFGGEQRYDRGDAEFTQPTRGRQWGDIELALRYDYLDLNSQNILGGAGEAYTVGLNYYINNSVRIQLNYQYNNNDRYANGKGKLIVGRDADGVPTKDPKKVAAASGQAGVDYSMLALRFEIDF